MLVCGNGERMRSACRALGFACVVALLCLLVGCAQGGQGQNSQEEPTDAAVTQEDTSAKKDEATKADATTADGSGEATAKADADATKDNAASTSADNSKVDKALAERWKKDFERLADASGMDVCVSAVDLTTGTTATHQSNKKVLSASMIKLLIAETFLRQVSEGTHALDDVYVLKQTDIVGGAGSLGGRGAGAEVTKRELLQKMISESDNVGANVLMDLCGMDAINDEAKRLGLSNTVLGRHMMDSAAVEQGLDNYTCADDVAVLLRMVYDKTFVNAKMSAVMLETLEAQTDNDCLSQGLPAGVTFAHKTGSLATVRHDGGIVEGDKPFVIVTLCGGEGFTEKGAQDAMKQIAEAAYNDLYE